MIVKISVISVYVSDKDTLIKTYTGQTTFVHLICLKGQKSLSSLYVLIFGSNVSDLVSFGSTASNLVS